MKMFLAVALIILGAAPALAQQSGGPAQNGNVYDGTAHEPNAGVVHTQEKNAGIAPPPAQQQRLNNDVEALGHAAEQNAAGARAKAACAVNNTGC